ncbi:Cytochrome P450 [Arabidopsis thaliana x Arabidopsis arenosa]|uniref:Cytochrome P450 n=1 Tax=Arabidopsis thaliana x Arabidopsis arenosa TaxID=1240361 RepID=A0A8T2AUU9_9BRAS|nr:Cytochrome P450 [Arabidopsis thaliana x Arabidopsis arenosa]
MATIVVDFPNCLIVISLFSLLCFSVFLFKKPKDSRGCDLPPSPPSLPIIGHLHLILSVLPHKSFQNLSSKYGPLLCLRIFNVPIVLISSASVAYEIFKTHDVNISSHGDPPIDECLFFGSSSFVLAPYGDYWKFMKKLMVTKLFGTQALERLRRDREDELERFHANLVSKEMKSESVEIAKEAIKLTNNSICKMIMGRNCLEENGEAERVRGLVTETFALFKKLFLTQMLRRLFEILRISLFKKEILGVSCKFDELLERILAEHEEKPDYHGMDMMDVLLAAYRDENAEYKITRNQIKSLFVELILGGTDTSAQTIEWTMAEIIDKPNILERLRKEIDSVVGKTRLIQEKDLPNLPYLQAVIKEGLRLHPPAPLLGRKVLEGCTIGGCYVPKNTSLFVNAYAVMRDPDSWEDPDEFKPERFLATSGQKEEEREQELKYIPFGSGRRGCPGVNLAYIFVGTAIGMMVHCFDWRINGDKVNREETVAGLTLNMAHPLRCTPVARMQTLTPNLQNLSS